MTVPAGAEDPAPSVCSRLLLLPAHPQAQSRLHPGSCRCGGRTGPREGRREKGARTGFSQTPVAGHRTLSRQRLPACLPTCGPSSPPTLLLLQGLPVCCCARYGRIVTVSICALPDLAHLSQCLAHSGARQTATPPSPAMGSVPGLPLRARDRGRASKLSAHKGRAMGGWSGEVGAGRSRSRP